MKAKKVMALALAAVMLICATVAATVAYLKDDDSVVNTFTVGKVYINLDEFDYDKDENNEDNVTVNGEVRDKANKYHLLPGQTYSKDPTVTVKADSENCYVRVLVTVNDISKLKKAMPSFVVNDGTNDVFLLQNLVTGWFNNVWQYKDYSENTSKVIVDGVETNVTSATYEFWYVGDKAVNGYVPKASTNTVLEDVFTHIVVPATLGNDEIAYLAGVQIDVVAHAIQAAGFTDAADAWFYWSWS